MDRLPKEILFSIYSLLENPIFQLSFKLVCKSFHAASNLYQQRLKISKTDWPLCLKSASISFFEWTSICEFKVSLQLLVQSDNLALIQYAMNVLQFPISLDIPFVTSSLECLEYLESRSIPFGIEACKYAARQGCPPIVQKLIHKVDCLRQIITHEAAKGGHMDILVYLHSLKPLDEITFSTASKNGYIEIVKFGVQNNYNMEYSFYKAIKNDYLEILQYLYPYCSLDQSYVFLCFYKAVHHGRIRIVTYLKELGLTCDEKVYRYVPKTDAYQVIDYLHRNVFPLNESICLWAAENGHVEIVKYALQNQLKIDFYKCLMHSLESQQKSVLKQILMHGLSDDRIHGFIKKYQNVLKGDFMD